MKMPWFYWITAIFYALLIFLLSFFALPWGERLGGYSFFYSMLRTAGIICGAALLLFVWKNRRNMTVSRGLALSAVLLVYAFFYFNMRFPVEWIHLINFAILAILLKKAFECSSGTPHVYKKAAALTVFFGSVDELLQKFIPGRFADWHDVGLCIAGALLGCTLAWVFTAPDKPRTQQTL